MRGMCPTNARLPDTSLDKIMELNNRLPGDQWEKWVTVAEIQDHLVMGGVDWALTVKHILSAMNKFNRREQLLRRRRDRGASYYRPPDFEDECPDDQSCWKESGHPNRLFTRAIMPPMKGYLKSNPNT